MEILENPFEMRAGGTEKRGCLRQRHRLDARLLGGGRTVRPRLVFEAYFDHPAETVPVFGERRRGGCRSRSPEPLPRPLARGGLVEDDTRHSLLPPARAGNRTARRKKLCPAAERYTPSADGRGFTVAELIRGGCLIRSPVTACEGTGDLPTVVAPERLL